MGKLAKTIETIPDWAVTVPNDIRTPVWQPKRFNGRIYPTFDVWETFCTTVEAEKSISKAIKALYKVAPPFGFPKSPGTLLKWRDEFPDFKARLNESLLCLSIDALEKAEKALESKPDDYFETKTGFWTNTSNLERDKMRYKHYMDMAKRFDPEAYKEIIELKNKVPFVMFEVED